MLIKQGNLSKWVQRWLALLFITGAAVAGLIWTWGTWPDVIVDFGRELYVPWRLTEGQVLYRDIVSFNGPLSPYVLAVWFGCFGVSLQSVVILNILIIAGVLYLLYMICLRMGGRTSAILACLTFLTCFAFAQLLANGNFDWVCPYSHEITHGVALSLLSVYLLFGFSRKAGLVWICASGFVLGLVFLTKAEVFLAALAGNLAGIVAVLWLRRCSVKSAVQVFLLWAAFAVMPVVGSCMLLSLAMNPAAAFYATMGTWPYFFRAEHRTLLFFKSGMGILDMKSSIFCIMKWIGWYVLLFAPSGVLAFLCRRRQIMAWYAGAVLFVAVSGVFFWLSLNGGKIDWYRIAYPWQVFLLAAALVVGWRIFRRRAEPADQPTAVLQFSMAVFSLCLLAKMILNVRISHYGFALAMPAAMMVIVILWDGVPKFLQKFGAEPVVLRGAVLGAWLMTVCAYIGLSHYFVSQKQYVIGKGRDEFRCEERGEFVEKAMQFLTTHADPADTLVVLPEGIMLNYQLRMRSPAPYIQYTPPLMMLYGESRMLASLQDHPPDWIVLIHRDDSEYGARFFGREYGRLLWRWITGNYDIVSVIGRMPFTSKYFGILITKHKTSQEAGLDS